ncbi:ATP-grasp domain-containing protein [Facklamia sp. P12937]|uniref:ATP-grasp domain-containing protein n=1 Tax=Facklamia sp. P12937 TaxID=3421949 RepID=UPI003D176AE0
MENIIGLIAGSSGDSLIDRLHFKGYKVALIAGKKGEPGSDKADYLLETDLSNSNKIINFFNRLNVKKVLIGTGHIKALELVGNRDFNFITNINLNRSMLAKDKLKFKKEILAHNIYTPKFFSFDNIQSLINKTEDVLYELKFPLVVKPNKDIVLPVKVNNIENMYDSAKLCLQSNNKIIVEEYIEGNDCTVPIYYNLKDSPKSLGVVYYSKAKEYKLNGFSEAKSEKMSPEIEQRIQDMALKVVKSLNIPGLSRVDIILDEKELKPYVLELNSIIVTGYNGSSYNFFKNQNIDISAIMIDTSLEMMGEL